MQIYDDVSKSAGTASVLIFTDTLLQDIGFYEMEPICMNSVTLGNYNNKTGVKIQKVLKFIFFWHFFDILRKILA